mmetsp:Transcript_36889/g.83496  ORF Transcript_36889/g.83496 Transcript_36889/m.83496 type:complete len:203 (-) Transcript_36889:650-1258(-)
MVSPACFGSFFLTTLALRTRQRHSNNARRSAELVLKFKFFTNSVHPSLSSTSSDGSAPSNCSALVETPALPLAASSPSARVGLAGPVTPIGAHSRKRGAPCNFEYAKPRNARFASPTSRNSTSARVFAGASIRWPTFPYLPKRALNACSVTEDAMFLMRIMVLERSVEAAATPPEAMLCKVSRLIPCCDSHSFVCWITCVSP